MTVHVAGTAPYAWPYDGRILGSSLALVLAGWDDHWAARAADPANAAAAADQVASLVEAVVALGGRTIVVAHQGAPLSVADRGATEVRSAGVDGFWGSPLDAVLRSDHRTHLLLAGHGLEGPVHSTLRSANDRGYECLLVADACSALTDDLAGASAKTVTMSGGIFGAVGTTADVVAALNTSANPTWEARP